MRPPIIFKPGRHRQDKNKTVPATMFTIPSENISVAIAGEYNISFILSEKIVM
jgi:hypothetical protein